MHRSFGGTAFEPAEEKRDRELTLGPLALAFLGALLFGVCGLCFVWGYSVGHRAPIVQAVQPAAAETSAANRLSSQSKPTASDTNLTQHTDAQAESGTGSPAATSVVDSSSIAASTGSVPSGGTVVQAALPAKAASVQPAASANAVQPALGGNWMVQIAAVSHSEDADVLVSALRKRGYAVSVHRDPGDDLIHVQVGPFGTHAEAAAMRQRLLNDGYNAIIEP